MIQKRDQIRISSLDVPSVGTAGAVKKNHGVVLLSAHFTLLEITAFIGREAIAPKMPEMVGMYRLGSNPIISSPPISSNWQISV